MNKIHWTGIFHYSVWSIIGVTFVILISYYLNKGVNDAWLIGQIQNKEIISLNDCKTVKSDQLKVTCDKIEREHKTPFVVRWMYMMTYAVYEDTVMFLHRLKETTIGILIFGFFIAYIVLSVIGKGNPIINNYIPQKQPQYMEPSYEPNKDKVIPMSHSSNPGFY